MRKSMRAEYWRVAETHDREDFMQEAHYVFLKLAARYPLVEGPQHFMGLFKTAWSNHLIELAQVATRARRLVPEVQLTDDEGAVWDRETIGDFDNDGVLTIMVAQAPAEVRMVLSLFLTAPQEIFDLAQSTWRQSGRYRADGEAFVRRALGLPDTSFPLRAVFDYFGTN